MSYNPKPETAKWLTWALEKAQGLPYTPTARWVFYRLVQEFGFKKSDYKKFLGATSKARKRYWNGWTPTTFADDTRAVINGYGDGFRDAKDFFTSMKDRRPKFNIEDYQDQLVIVCFEAKAMVGQFKHHLNKYRVLLAPFGGDASIPYKYDLARRLQLLRDQYPDKPITVLYFGDYDPKGMEIPENAMRDIRAWCDVEFTYRRVGINLTHIKRFNIPDNPDAPGKYQWEALEDEAAKALLDEIFKIWSKATCRQINSDETDAAVKWELAVTEAIDGLVDDEEDDDT